MEVLQAVRFADGRLLVLAVGVGRFRVDQVSLLAGSMFCCKEADRLLVPAGVAIELMHKGCAGSQPESTCGGSMRAVLLKPDLKLCTAPAFL